MNTTVEENASENPHMARDQFMTFTLPALPTVVLMIGAAGAGKSTFAERLATGHPDAKVVSIEAFRAQIGNGPGDHTVTPAAVAEALNLLHRRCVKRRTTIFDATSTHAEHRQAVTAIAANHGIPVLAVVVDTPLQLCLDRQRPRDAGRRVPPERVRAQHAAVVEALPALLTEGYAGLHIVRPLSPTKTGPARV